MSIAIKLTLFASSLFLLASCQQEIKPEVEIEVDGIQAEDPLARDIVAVATKDGSQDNIIDGASCTTVVFPVRGLVEDDEVVFNSLAEVEALGAGVLEVEWVFPMQVVLADHRAVTLPTEDDLEDIQDNCIEGGGDADNECIDFEYPFSIRVFDQRTEEVYTREVTSDEEAYRVFSSRDLIIALDFPIGLVDAANRSIQVASKEELASALTGARSTCDEEDIIAFEDQFEEEFRALFIGATWRVGNYTEEGTDGTPLFNGIVIVFNEDNTLQSTGNAVEEGDWEIELLDTGQAIFIEFDTETQPLFLLNHTWVIENYSQGEINLLYQEEPEEGTKRLQLLSM